MCVMGPTLPRDEHVERRAAKGKEGKMKWMCEALPKPAELECRITLREAHPWSHCSLTNNLKCLLVGNKVTVAWMLLSGLKRRFLVSGRRGIYVPHRAPWSTLRTGISVNKRAGDHPHHRGTPLAGQSSCPLTAQVSGNEWAIKSMLRSFTTRSLLIVWAASLAYLVTPVSSAEPVSTNSLAGVNQFSAAEWTDCHTEWNLRFCAAPQTTILDDQTPEHHRVKARDVLRAMADALLGEGFQLLNIGRHSGTSFLERPINSRPVQYFLLSDSNGVRVRMRTKDDGWSVSLRESPNEFDEDSLAVKIGVDVRW